MLPLRIVAGHVPGVNCNQNHTEDLHKSSQWAATTETEELVMSSEWVYF